MQRSRPADTKTAAPTEAALSKMFQELIDCVGAENVLKTFASVLGRDDMDTLVSDGKTRQVNVPPKFTGIAFDGVHWKGYENAKMTYDSYQSGVQLAKTNNYCQSYACFLWASQGLENKAVGVALKAGDYAGNVMKMSGLWLRFFELYDDGGKGLAWLNDACPNWKSVVKTLSLLSTNAKLAASFASSKQ